MAIAASVAAVGIAGARASQLPAPPQPAAAPARDVAWRVELTSKDVSGVAASNSTVVVTTSEATLAYSAEDGRLLWSKPTGSERSPVRIRQDFAILTASGVDVLSSDGSLVWQRKLPGVTDAIATGSDLILVAGRTVAKWSGGWEIWRFDFVNPEPATPPVLHGDTLLIGLKPASVSAWNSVKGQAQWSLDLPSPPDALGIAPDRLMVCTSEGNSTGLLSSYRMTRDHKLDWAYAQPRCIGAPASDDNRTYAAFMDNTVKAFNTGSGHQRWTGRLPTRPFAGPIRFPNSIVVPLSNGAIAEFTLDGQPVGGSARPESLPKSLRMLAAATSPDRTRVFTTGASSDIGGARQLFAWARPAAKKSGGPEKE